MPEDITKLPKWAQSNIKMLEMRVESLEKKMREINGDSPTNIFFSNGIDEKKGLPKHSTVMFGEGNARIECHLKKDGNLHISSCFRSVLIRPIASNCFDVSVKED